jgi:hypothetical protein
LEAVRAEMDLLALKALISLWGSPSIQMELHLEAVAATVTMEPWRGCYGASAGGIGDA